MTPPVSIFTRQHLLQTIATLAGLIGLLPAMAESPSEADPSEISYFFDNNRIADLTRSEQLKSGTYLDLDYGLDGSIWVRLADDEVAQITSARIRVFDEDHGLKLNTLDRLVVLEDGTPWVVSNGKILALNGDQFEPPAGLEQQGLKGEVVDVIKAYQNQVFIVTENDPDKFALYQIRGHGVNEIRLPHPNFRPRAVETDRGVGFLVADNNSVYRTQSRDDEVYPEKVFEAPDNHTVSFLRSRDMGDCVLSIGPIGTVELHTHIGHRRQKDLQKVDLSTLKIAAIGRGINGDLILSGLDQNGHRVYRVRDRRIYPVSPYMPSRARGLSGVSQDSQGAYWIYGRITLSSVLAEGQLNTSLIGDSHLVAIDKTGEAWLDYEDHLRSSQGRIIKGALISTKYSKPWAIDTDQRLIPLSHSEKTIRPEVHGIDETWRVYDGGSPVAYQRSDERVQVRNIARSKDAVHIPLHRKHDLLFVAYAEDYYWIISLFDSAIHVLRWDPILKEAFQQKIAETSVFSPENQVRFSINQNQAHLWTGDSFFVFDKNLRHIHDPFFSDELRITSSPLFANDAQVLIPIQDNGGEFRLWISNAEGEQLIDIDHENWMPKAVDNQGRLVWLSRNREWIGRSFLEDGAIINPIDMHPLRIVRDSIQPGSGNELFFNAYIKSSLKASAVAYTAQDFIPKAEVNILTELVGEKRNVIAQIQANRENLRTQQEVSIQFSWRLDGGTWSPYQSMGDGRVELGPLDKGDYEIQIRTRNQDFIANPIEIRHPFEISPNPLQDSRWFTPTVYGIGALFLVLMVLLMQRAWAAHHANKILKMEVDARQQAQIDLIDINEDLEKRVKLRTQELVFANESLKKQVDERKQAEDRLKESHTALMTSSRQAGMAEIATGILHNVGNVLNSLNVSLEMIKTRTGREDQARGLEKLSKLIEDHTDEPAFLTANPKGKKIPEYLKRLSQNAQSHTDESNAFIIEMTKKVDHLKEIVSAQQDYAKVAGVIESFDLGEAVDQMLKLNEHDLKDDHIEVTLNTRDCPDIQAERPKVQQIVLNLIQNAQWACNQRSSIPSRIDIRGYLLNPQTIAIEVKDNGIGINPEHIRKIFFHGFTTREDGHGFGLHTAINMASEMQGKLEAFSDGQNTGSTFRLSLPLELKNKKSNAEIKEWTHPSGTNGSLDSHTHANSIQEALMRSSSRSR
ncbi:MAG: ATP-binding protein [Opitutales bacterium]|nr:ATP-binding protein [Opitutales bacterium]NRA25670.1 hypothetical protein [Opitutales bacterium]